MQRTNVETGETFDLSEPDNLPSSFLTYGNDGRMMVLNLAGQRPKPASAETMTDGQRNQLFRTMVAYAGTYTFDGHSMFHHIDISWNELWTGTTQVRTVTRDGARLVFVTSPAPWLYSKPLAFITVWAAGEARNVTSAVAASV